MLQITKQARLDAECLKPRLQAPCQLFQKHKCIRKKNGTWKIKSCHGGVSSLPPLDFDSITSDDECVCDGELEKKLQRRFIKKHLSTASLSDENGDRRKLRPKFLKDLSGDYDEDSAVGRSRRSPYSGAEDAFALLPFAGVFLPPD